MPQKIVLNWWEGFILQAAIGFLNSLIAQYKLNPVLVEAIKAVEAFILQLVGGVAKAELKPEPATVEMVNVS